MTAMGASGSPVATGPSHPDAELLAAWDQWLAAMRDSYLDRLTEAEFEEAYQSAADRIVEMPARTVAGALVKLKLGFHDVCEMPRAASVAFVFSGEPPASVLTGDHPHRALWEGIKSVEQLADGRAVG